MDRWEKFDETSLPYQKALCSELSLEDIIDKDCIHDQKLFKEFKLKDLGEYHDLYVQSDTLLLPDVFENFRNECIETYKLDSTFFICTLISISNLFIKDNSKIRVINRYLYVIDG